MNDTDKFEDPWKRKMRLMGEDLRRMRKENELRRAEQLKPPIDSSELIKDADPVRGH